MAKLELDLRVSLKDIPTGSVELVFVKWWRNVRQKYRQSLYKKNYRELHFTRKNDQRIIFIDQLLRFRN